MKQFRQPTALGVLALSTIVLSFLMTRYVLRELGAGVRSDALFAGMTIPQLFFEVISYSMSYVVLPLLSTEEPEQRRADAWTLAQGVGAIFIALAALLWFATPLWTPWLVSGFDPAGKALTISLTRIQLLGMVFTSVTGILSCYQYSCRRFVRTEASSAIAAGVGLVFLVKMLPVAGVTAGAWSLVLRAAVEMILMTPGIGRYRKPNFRSFVTRQTVRRIRPLILATSYSRSAPAIDRYLASMAPAGSLSLLNLGRQVQDAVTRIQNKALTNPILPALAEFVREGNRSMFDRTYKQRVLWVGVSTAVLTVAVLGLGFPLIRVIFASRNVTAENISLLWTVMLALAGVQFGYGMRNVLAGAFYSMGNTRTPTKIDALCYTIGIPLRILGFKLFGVVGIALGTSAFYILDGLLLQYVLTRTPFECAEQAQVLVEA